MWDVRSGKEIHKFDKLNQAISGVFHPNGLEVNVLFSLFLFTKTHRKWQFFLGLFNQIVSNTEVWDLRTFHLLRTVPALDQCLVTFSPQNVIYGISPEIVQLYDVEQVNYSYDTSFKTLDSYDYSSIGKTPPHPYSVQRRNSNRLRFLHAATVDVKRNIYDLSINKYGSQIAIVENQGDFESGQESAVRIYSVGRKKNMEDEVDEEDDDMAVSDDGTMSDNDSLGTFDANFL